MAVSMKKAMKALPAKDKKLLKADEKIDKKMSPAGRAMDLRHDKLEMKGKKK